MALSQTQKLELIRGIESEDDLRENLLVPLFTEMEVYESVVTTHGASERGKDIVLIRRDEMGDLNYTAVIVKRGDISNATSGKKYELVANICAQIALTINSGYNCTKQNRHVQFYKLMVITNGAISNTARDEMVNAAQIHHFTQLSFKSCDELRLMVDEHLPDFYTTAGGETSRYINLLRKKCDRLEELKNISIYKGDIRHILEVYVTPTLWRINRDLPIQAGVSETKPVLAKFERILYEKQHALVLGGPGSGKSTLLRAQVQRLIDSNGRGRAVAFPVYARAVDLIPYLGGNLEEVLTRYVQKEYDLPDFDLKSYSAKPSTTLYIFIDGTEEIFSDTVRKQLQAALTDFVKSNDRHKLVLTSRDISDANMWLLQNMHQWHILPFRINQVKEFIAKWFNADPSTHPLLAALQDHELLSKLPQTPLVLTLLAILFDHNTDTEVPANLSELYQMFTDLLLGKWNLDRRINKFFVANIREFVLVEIAVHMHQEGVVALSQDAFSWVIRQCSEHLGRPIDVEMMKADLVDSLLSVNDKDEIEFRHLSFQEFLVAKRFAQRSTVELEDTLLDKFTDDWWAPVLYHYCGLRRENQRVLETLVTKFREYDLIPAIKAAWNYGYLIQSSYLTSADCRVHGTASFVKYYSERISQVLRDHMNQPPFRDMAPGLVLVMFVELFRVHYASRFLVDLYRDVVSGLHRPPNTFEDKLELLLAAALLCTDESADHLIEIYDEVSSEPAIVFALDFLLAVRLESDALKGKHKQLAKDLRTRVRRKFLEAESAYKLIAKASRKSPVSESGVAQKGGDNTLPPGTDHLP